MQFDQFAANYEHVLNESIALSGEDSAFFATYKARYLSEVMSPSLAKILDFGCGVGLLARFLKSHRPDAQVDGFDVSEDSIRRIDESLLRQGTFTCRLAELGNDYDLIVVANVMHHIEARHRASVVSDLSGRLSRAGKLAIIEHNPRNPVTRWVVEHCPFDDDAVLLTPAEGEDYLKGAGLDIFRRDYIVFMPRFLAYLRPMERWLRWLPLGAQYALLAGKNAE
jgi:trans-aconitate methyltransferase